jgi:hypothetical protein
MSAYAEWTVEALLASFDDHLRRVRGVGSGTRVNYRRYVGRYLDTGAWPVVKRRMSRDDGREFRKRG